MESKLVEGFMAMVRRGRSDKNGNKNKEEILDKNSISET